MPVDPRPETSDLHLDALRYLLEEMDAQERAAFEALLSEGGEACEALADAVLVERSTKVVGASRSALAPPASAGQRRLLRSAAAGTVVAVLFVAAALIWPTSPTGEPETGRPPGRTAATQRKASAEELKAVAEMWSLLGAEQPPLHAGDSEHLSEFDESADALSQVCVPDWMLTAIGAEPNEQQDSEPLMELEGEERL